MNDLLRERHNNQRGRRSVTTGRLPTPVGHRPTPGDVAFMRTALAPWKWITAPRVSGREHLPVDRPALLAANHTTWAVLDSPLLLLELYETRGVLPRTLGDHLHWRVPVWRALLERFGVVDGTPANVRALMRAGEWILVFPGGAREVFKRRGEKYTLVWGERTGFARMAIESGYPIVPVSLVGAEDAYDIVLDADDLLASPFGPLVRRLAPRPDVIPPVVRGLGPTVVPRPERFYFHFGAPVETRHLAGRERDDRTCFAVRERVRQAIEDGIVRLLRERERDPDRSLLARTLAPHGAMVPAGSGREAPREMAAAGATAPRR
jgi:1-acyl-sn-glycerol-3-phosphate acyltransferase